MRGGELAAPLLALVCGVATAYTALQPEFAHQKEEREGKFTADHTQARNNADNALSQAIISDIKEAGREVKATNKKGFAWGIREAIWGKPEDNPANPGSQAQDTSDRKR